jgi:predicted amidophosphoribosyltransferase
MMVKFVVFCSNCGEKLPENAYFCPRCGVRTEKGLEAGMSTPWEDLREAFAKMGEEIEKAFSVAGKEMEQAFKTARGKIREVTSREPVACPHCGEKNVVSANFCSNCGKKLKQESV